MAMNVVVSEFDVADAIRRGDLSLGIVLNAIALHPPEDLAVAIVNPAADYIRFHSNPDATRAMLRDLLTQSERPARAAG